MAKQPMQSDKKIENRLKQVGAKLDRLKAKAEKGAGALSELKSGASKAFHQLGSSFKKAKNQL